MTAAPSAALAKRTQWWLVLATVTLLSLAWLLLVSGPPDLIADTARDLLMARDCSELGHCLTVGAKTSLDGFYQGGAWLQSIALLQSISAGIRTIQAAVIALEVLSCAFLYVFLSRWTSSFVSALAALIWLSALCYLGDHSLLWNHSGVALPVVLADGALLLFVTTRRTLALCVAAFWTGLGMGFHVECAVLVPAEVAFAVLAARRPRVATPAMLLAFLLALLPTSLEATRANLLFLAGSRAGVPLLVGVAVLVVVAAAGRSRFLKARGGTQLAWLAAAIIVPPAAGLLWLELRGHLVALRYAYAALPAAAAVAAVVLDRGFCSPSRRAIGPGAAGLFAGALVSWLLWTSGSRAVLSRLWTGSEGKTIAARLDASGYSYDAVRWHLQGPRAWELITVLAAYLPPPHSPQLPLDKPDLLILRPPPAGSEPGSSLHPPGRPPLLVRSIRPWLDFTRGQVCILPARAGRDTEPRCTKLATRPEKTAGFRFRSRSYPRLFDTTTKPPYIERFEIPVHPAGSDARRFIHVLDARERCRWLITGVHGARYHGRLPARDLVLERGGSGDVTFTRRVDPVACPGQLERYTRPSIAETHPDEVRLRRALEAR